jgi:hypothetical protein
MTEKKRNKQREEIAKQKFNPFVQFEDKQSLIASKRKYLFKNDTYVANKLEEYANEGRYLRQFVERMDLDDLYHLNTQCSAHAHSVFKEAYRKKEVVYEDEKGDKPQKKKKGETPGACTEVRKMQKVLNYMHRRQLQEMEDEKKKHVNLAVPRASRLFAIDAERSAPDSPKSSKVPLSGRTEKLAKMTPREQAEVPRGRAATVIIRKDEWRPTSRDL